MMHASPSRSLLPLALFLCALSWSVAHAAQTGGAEPGAEPAAAHHARPPGIDWFDGDPAAAFAQAGAAGKPVFLYWGAVWCPPCQELKATIFQRQDFRNRLHEFVPVFLDGDSAGAQAWGERFHVLGYPTVLVLRADQSVVERVSGGMDLTRYAEVLDLALGQVRPVRELLDGGTNGGADSGAGELPADDCRRLAYNAWSLDDAWILRPESLGGLAAQLAQAAQRCPAGMGIERARLQMTAVQAALGAEQDALKVGAAPSEALKALLAKVPAILADGTLAERIGDTLFFLPAEFFPAAAGVFAPQGGAAGRDALRRRWFERMDALAEDKRYSAADRMDAVRSKLLAAKALSTDGKVPAAIAAAATRRIDGALAHEHEPYARASLVNEALNALDVVGDDRRAHDILSAEARTSAYGYYYMADLGELEEKLGHPDLALEWLARSYREAQGPATRFQWGVGYVRGLVRMRPQDETAIREAALAVLGELDAAGDLHGRTLRSLRRMEASLRDWDKDASHAGAVGALRDRVAAICGRLPADDSARPSCAQFLAGA